ncbi:hypothetical protein K523DRAFT_328504, partial [Schizophyllum commune Tattone D]
MAVTTQALKTRDILWEIGLHLTTLGDRGRFVRVSTDFALAGMPILWSELPGLLPFLSLAPRNCRRWKTDRDARALHLQLRLTEQQCSAIVARSRFVKLIKFRLGKALRDCAVYAAFEANPLLAPLLPTLRVMAVSMQMQVSYFTNGICCRLLGALATAFPRPTQVLIGGVVGSVRHLSALHVEGQSLYTIRVILQSQRAWRFEELCIRNPGECLPPTDIIDLFTTMGKSCTTLRRFEFLIDTVGFAPPLVLTPELLQVLSPLRLLTEVIMEAPMISLLGNRDWQMVASQWPDLERFCVVSSLSWRI